MNFKKIIISTLILTGLGTFTAMASNQSERLVNNGTGWTGIAQFNSAHVNDITTEIFSKCTLNASHTSQAGRTYSSAMTHGQAISNSNISTAYLQSGVMVDGVIRKGYVGNKNSKADLSISGKHPVYEGHTGYIK